MKEKVKGHPRRRLFWLFGLLVFLLGGYFSLPFAQTAFINWWKDDPFTPICNVPNLRLTLISPTINTNSSSHRFFAAYQTGWSDIMTFGETYRYMFGIFSPDGHWLAFKLNGNRQIVIWNLAENREQLKHSGNSQYTMGFWLADNRFLSWSLADAEGQGYWTIIDPQAQTIQSPARLTPEHSIIMYVNTPIESLTYFLTYEYVTEPDSQNLSLQVVRYDRELVPTILQRLPNISEDTRLVEPQLSPDGRYLSYRIFSDSPSDGFYIVDLEAGHPEAIRILDNSAYYLVWSPDSTYFAYPISQENQDSGIGFYSLEAQSTLFIQTIEGQQIRVEAWFEDGLWIIAEDLPEEDTEVFLWDEIYQASFEGTQLSYESKLRRSSDLEDAQAVSGNLLAVRNTNGLVLYDDEGQVLLERDAEIDFSVLVAEQRFLSYYAANDWYYLLDLDSLQLCRFVKVSSEEFSFLEWRIIPQS